MIFNIEITDAGKLAGITAAREAYNATQEPTVDEQGNEVPAATFTTDEEYVQFVMDKAAESYSVQYAI